MSIDRINGDIYKVYYGKLVIDKSGVIKQKLDLTSRIFRNSRCFKLNMNTTKRTMQKYQWQNTFSKLQSIKKNFFKE